MKITKEEILKLGKISMIDISDNDIPLLIKRLESLLNYACCLQDLSKQDSAQEIPQIPHNINIVRDDSIIQVDSTPIINLAPESTNNYFVVPVILKDSKQ